MPLITSLHSLHSFCVLFLCSISQGSQSTFNRNKSSYCYTSISTFPNRRQWIFGLQKESYLSIVIGVVSAAYHFSAVPAQLLCLFLVVRLAGLAEHLPCMEWIYQLTRMPYSSVLLLVTKNTGLLSLPSHDDYHECWVNKYRSSSLAALLAPSLWQNR